MKIEGLRPGMENIDLDVTVLNLKEPKHVTTYSGLEHVLVEGEVEDDTGKAFPSYRDVNFHDLARGAGAGIRIEIPLMGLLGFDMGYGFDRAQPGWEAHFQINPYGIF